MTAKKVLIIGSSNMDLALNVYRVPAPGETVIDDGGVAYTPGGKGANAAVAFSRLGAKTVFSTKLGVDAHGIRLYEFYKEEGIDTSYIKVDRDFPTGFSVVMKEGNGQNRIIVYPGANTRISTENMVEAFSCAPDALFLGFEIGFESALIAARIAASRNIPIFVDAAPAEKRFALESLPYVEIFSPNETETYEYTGIMPNGSDSSLKAALALWKRVNCKYIVIKQGERGASLYDGKRFDMIPAERVGEVVDTTAAGDTFSAAMTLEYLRSQDIKRAIRYGAAAAAIAVSRHGASSSVPTAEEVERFIYDRR